MKPFPFMTETPLLFGHRGYSSLAPENTLTSFGLCIERGIPGIELDVHLCRTGELVVVHDSNLKRVSGQNLVVEQLPFDTLRSLDVGSHKGQEFKGAQVPLLSEVFELCGDKVYYDIELKADSLQKTDLERKTWDTIRSHGLVGRCMTSSFNPFAIRRFNTLSKKAIPSAVIYAEGEGIPRFLQHGWGRHIAGCTYLKPTKEQVTEHTVHKFRTRKGYPICTWTVQTPQEAETALRLGIDGIITNAPGDFLPIVERFRKRRLNGNRA